MRLHTIAPTLLLAACAAAPVSDEEGAARPLHVGFVVVDGVYGSELVAPWDIFHHTVFHTEPGMRVFSVSHDTRLARTFEDVWLRPDYAFADAPEIDVLVVPSAEHSMDSDLEDAAMMRFVRERGAEADYLVSLCDGAFVLAAAGLLDGLESTTFPGDVARYREMFPHLVVHEGVSFVHVGRAITSAGGAKSYDPAMYLVEVLYGAAVARGVGRGMVIDWDVAEVPHVRVR